MKLILRKIIKIVAIRCHILNQKCTKSGFWLTPLSRPLAEFKGPTSKGGEGRRGWEEFPYLFNPTLIIVIIIIIIVF